MTTLDISFHDTIAIAAAHLRATSVIQCGQLPPSVSPTALAVDQIEKCLNELEGALALIPDLDALLLSRDLPYVRRLYKGLPFVSEGTTSLISDYTTCRNCDRERRRHTIDEQGRLICPADSVHRAYFEAPDA